MKVKFKKILKKKRATMDNLYVTIQVVGFAFFLLIAVVLWNNLTTEEMDEDIWSKTDVGISAKAEGQSAYNQMDNIFLFVYFGLHIGILVLAFFLRSFPFMLIAIFFIAAIIALISAPLSNVYQEVAAEEIFTEATVTLPKMDFIMGNLPKFEVIWTFVTGIILVGLARLD